MIQINSIGLPQYKAKLFAEELNKQLAHYSDYYQDTKGSHWNMNVDKSFAGHVKFEELYNVLVLKSDEIAEWILTLGFSPEHNDSHDANLSSRKEIKKVADGIQAVAHIPKAYKMIILKQELILSLVNDAKDKGTTFIMSDYISFQEKEVGIYTSF